jgi:small subunit ribosomal protein S2
MKKIKKVKTEKKSKRYELSINLKDLLEAGVHFGHRLSKTHPGSRDYVYTVKDGAQIIDLGKTYDGLEIACNFLYELVKSGKSVVFVGTKRSVKEVMKKEAVRLGMPWVTTRWLGGTISNWDQIKKNVALLEKLKTDLKKGVEGRTKREVSEMRKEMANLEKFVGGLPKAGKLFDAMIVVDIKQEKTAVREAVKKGIPVVAMVDTNVDASLVDYPIPGNDDAKKSVEIIVTELGRAIEKALGGKMPVAEKAEVKKVKPKEAKDDK